MRIQENYKKVKNEQNQTKAILAKHGFADDKVYLHLDAALNGLYNLSACVEELRQGLAQGAANVQQMVTGGTLGTEVGKAIDA